MTRAEQTKLRIEKNYKARIEQGRNEARTVLSRLAKEHSRQVDKLIGQRNAAGTMLQEVAFRLKEERDQLLERVERLNALITLIGCDK